MLLPDNFKEEVQENKRLRVLNDKVEPLIEITSIPGQDSNVDLLNLDWEITEANEEGLNFKLKYKDPLEIS